MRKTWIFIALALVSGAAAAEDLSASPAICASVKDDRARLACYDGLFAKTKAAAQEAPAAQSAPPAATASVSAPAVAPAPAAPMAAPPANKTDSFGAETIRKDAATEEKEADEEIHAKVTAVSFSATNKFTVTLDNGQVWRQIDGDTGRANFHADGDTVTISHGFLGSYNLVIGNRSLLFKVRRLR